MPHLNNLGDYFEDDPDECTRGNEQTRVPRFRKQGLRIDRLRGSVRPSPEELEIPSEEDWPRTETPAEHEESEDIPW